MLRRARPLAISLGVLVLAAFAVGSGTEARSQAPQELSAPAPATAAPTPPPASEGADEVVARVGDTVITRGELERRMKEAPRAALAELGSTPDEVKRNLLNRYLVRDVLMAEEAKARGIDKYRDIREKTLNVLRLALIEQIRRDAKVDDISMADIKTYYDANPAKFQMPRRLLIHRILVATKEEAEALIAELGPEPDSKEFAELAREKSLDKETNLRAGNLGLVSEGGETGEEERHVEPALYREADKVKDGELVPMPVAEQGKFAVVLRKQTVQPTSRSLVGEAPAIRAALADQRAREAVDKLLGDLRATHVKEKNAELTSMVSISPEGDVERARRPGTLPRASRTAKPFVHEGPAGLR